MANEIYYEWCYETVDEHGDIVEVDFEDALSNFTPDRITNELCLMRRVGNEPEGEIERHYAYVKDGKLPEYFSIPGAHEVDIKVPKRFIKELSNHLTPPRR